ncbi:MAG: hypothetical protein R6V67_00500, partial [Spirochaetia bacterium]
KAEGEEILHRFFVHRPLRFTVAEAVRVVSGRKSAQSLRKEDFREIYFGALGDWKTADIEQAVSSLIKRGVLKMVGRGPWKKRIRPGRLFFFGNKLSFDTPRPKAVSVLSLLLRRILRR